MNLLQPCWRVLGFSLPVPPMLPLRWRRFGHSTGIAGILDETDIGCNLCLARHWAWKAEELLRFARRSCCKIDGDRASGRSRKGCTYAMGRWVFEPGSPRLFGSQFALQQVLARHERLGLLYGESLPVLVPQVLPAVLVAPLLLPLLLWVL